jgi:hypothetical protein
MNYPESWNTLFARGEAATGEHLVMKVVRRNGHPFLLLPGRAHAASACLSLYAAQTFKGRAARLALKCVLKLGLPIGLGTISLPFEVENDFLRFLGSLAAVSDVPIEERLGVLAGNPGGTGQRLIILLFDQEFGPVMAVKAGLTPDAKQLIAKERDVLDALPASAFGKPELRSVFESESVQALALPFYPGHSPKGDQSEKIFAVLGSWISRTRSSPIVTTETWRRLRKAAGNDPLMKELEEKLGEREINLAIWHGDFAPWNIKVQHNQWTVLDWERGEINGIPGWDWFHYEIQTAILARKEPVRTVIDKIEAFLNTSLWRDYARMAGIAAFERELLLAYLANCVRVIKPSEGLEETDNLLKALAERWGIFRQ